MVSRHGLGTVIAFTAPRFIPVLVATFAIEYVTQVILSATNFSLARQRIFSSVSGAGRHTSIRVISPFKNGKRIAKEYVFHQPDTVPWGQPLPVQCPKCFSTRSLDIMNAGLANHLQSLSYSYKCRGCREEVCQNFGDTHMASWTLAIPVDKKRAWLEFNAPC